jgi:glycine/D-amino acid oxidase-like deaminating enzyme
MTSNTGAHPARSAKHCIVIGSGIIGASIAWHLAAGGAQVTILEAAQAGGIATRDSWAWINASWGNPEPYFRLRLRSMQEWQRLAREVPDLGLDVCGGLIWDLPPAQLEAFAEEHSQWGYPLQRLGAAEARLLEPSLQQAPAFALYAAQEGKVEPLAATLALLAAAQGLGATLHTQTQVSALVQRKGRVIGVRAKGALFEADEVVLAAGTGCAALLADLDIRYAIEAPPGLLVHSKATRPLLRRLLMAPGLHVRQTAEGRLVAGADYVGSVEGQDREQLAHALFGKVQAMVAGAAQLEMDFTTLGHRPTPGDGFPLLGRPHHTAGLYLAITHSGVTLAPAVGLFTAQELLQGMRDSLLLPYHPDRLLQPAESVGPKP